MGILFSRVVCARVCFSRWPWYLLCHFAFPYNTRAGCCFLFWRGNDRIRHYNVAPSRYNICREQRGLRRREGSDAHGAIVYAYLRRKKGGRIYPSIGVIFRTLACPMYPHQRIDFFIFFQTRGRRTKIAHPGASQRAGKV